MTLKFCENWTSDDGSVFLFSQEFEVTESEMQLCSTLPGCEGQAKMVLHHRFVYAGRAFWVPDYYVGMLTRSPQEDNRTNAQKFYDEIRKDAFDVDGNYNMIDATYQVFGIDIRVKDGPDKADYEIPEDQVPGYLGIPDNRPADGESVGYNALPEETSTTTTEETRLGDFNQDYDI